MTDLDLYLLVEKRVEPTVKIIWFPQSDKKGPWHLIGKFVRKYTKLQNTAIDNYKDLKHFIYLRYNLPNCNIGFLSKKE